MPMTNKKWSDDDLINAVKNSYSIRSVLSKLNVVEAGGNYATIKKHISRLNIDTSHFTGQSWNKGKVHKVKNLELVLVDGIETNTSRLRQRLIKANFFDKICSSCNLSKWLEKDIPLELDHINGIRTDNRIENLRLLCPNCHAQTDTYRGKNQARRKK